MWREEMAINVVRGPLPEEVQAILREERERELAQRKSDNIKRPPQVKEKTVSAWLRDNRGFWLIETVAEKMGITVEKVRSEIKGNRRVRINDAPNGVLIAYTRRQHHRAARNKELNDETGI